MLLEICVDALDSVAACAEGGADRIELCASLTEGGLTPSAGMLSQARSIFPGEIAVMIRPRGGDFVYQPGEVAAMAADIELARDLGADAVVFGCLSPDGEIDVAMAECIGRTNCERRWQRARHGIATHAGSRARPAA